MQKLRKVEINSLPFHCKKGEVLSSMRMIILIINIAPALLVKHLTIINNKKGNLGCKS